MDYEKAVSFFMAQKHIDTMTQIEKLIEKAHVDYLFGRTHLEDSEKKYMACSYAESCNDFNNLMPDGYEELPVFYGKTLKEVILKAVEWTENNI